MSHTQQTNTDLIDRLKDPKEADLYMTSILERCKTLDKKEADELMLDALRNIAQARPEDVHVDVSNENSFKLKALLRVLHFVSKKFI